MSAPAWIGSIVAVLGLAFAFYRWRQTDRAVFVDARPYPFSLPPAFREALFEGAEVLGARTGGQFTTPGLPAPVNHLLDRFAWIDSIRLGGTSEVIDTIWDIRIENRGGEAVTQAQLRLEGAVASILRARGADSHLHEEMIQLPNLSPGESVTIRAWSKGGGGTFGPQLHLQKGRARVRVVRAGDFSWGTSGRPSLSVSFLIVLAFLGGLAILALILDSAGVTISPLITIP